jgi:hypothetical protein
VPKKPVEFYTQYIGQKFGRLTTIRYFAKDRPDQNKHAYYECICECGNKTECRLEHLKKGKIKSCGCLSRELASKRNKGKTPASYLPDNLSAKRRIFKNYKREALERGLEFPLDFDYFIELVQKNCHYDNTPPTRVVKVSGSKSRFICNGIDRKDNTKGYTVENSVPCCTKCNFAKSKYNYEDFLKWIADIYNNLDLGNKHAEIKK